MKNISKKIKTLLQISFILVPIISCFSQSKDGYWDNIRTTNQTFSLKAGEQKIITSEALPEGTTEFVYRITILDKNQQISSSLVSLLKSIPDPTGISKGAAGGVFLLSTISGEDKSKYALFSTTEDANSFIKNSNSTKACYVQETPISKDAKVISLQTKCFQADSKNVFFVFESDNWVMSQTVLLEIVPWVDLKLNSGWNSNSKQDLLNLSKNQKVYPLLKNKDAFSAQFIEKISQKFSKKEFESLILVEKNQQMETFTEQILTNTGEIEVYYSLIRNQSKKAFEAGNIEEAISILNKDFFSKKRATTTDFYQLSKYYLVSKQFDKADKICKEGLQMDASEIKLLLQQAHIYMFTDKLSASKEIHEKYKNQNINTNTSWVNQAKKDFELFEKSKLPNSDFKKILRILE